MLKEKEETLSPFLEGIRRKRNANGEDRRKRALWAKKKSRGEVASGFRSATFWLSKPRHRESQLKDLIRQKVTLSQQHGGNKRIFARRIQ